MEKDYTINKAKKEDIIGIYDLLHREFIKKYSPNSEKFEWEKHEKWYEFWINSPYYCIYVLKNKEKKIIGQIRYEIDCEISTINIYIDKKNRNKGLANKFIEETIKDIKLKKEDIKLILAYVLEENENSKKLFQNLGFITTKKGDYNGVEHFIYTKKI